MRDSKYKWILYFIVLVISGTIAIQIYWNFKNYETNKQQLVNEVQASLDNAVERYFANIAERNTAGLAIEMLQLDALPNTHRPLDSILYHFDFSRTPINPSDSIDIRIDADNIKIFKGHKADSAMISDFISRSTTDPIPPFKDLRMIIQDSFRTDSFENLTSKVIISMTNDSIRLRELDSFFQLDIANKALELDHKLHLYKTNDDLEAIQQSPENKEQLYCTSKSPFLPKNRILSVSFSNASKEILKRSLTGISISILLVLAVISCLFYLLKVITHQKQLAEVKNDLISNITHEFKTPIATIGVALESITNFDMINNKDKTKTYLDMSHQQLQKLNAMVEKLLETATLDSETLELQKEPVDLSDLMNTLVNKHQMTTTKSLVCISNPEAIAIPVDLFHFENAISNIIDNAIKYGGKAIEIALIQNADQIELRISDNGHSLTHQHKDKIFEKFYRVPKGNTHDVKGFGIGLYYTKTIIEKHGGSIHLELAPSLTTFKIVLPYGH